MGNKTKKQTLQEQKIFLERLEKIAWLFDNSINIPGIN